MKTPLLQVRNLTVDIKSTRILADVSFSIPRGEVLALLGESGSGKTFTALSIMRLLPPETKISEASSIKLAEEDLLKLSEVGMRKVRGKKIGLVFQEPVLALNPVLSIGEQLKEVFREHTKLSSKQIRERALGLLREVGFTHPRRIYAAYPHQLSGGMRQRVVIAIAIAVQSDLLIADEATSALDVTTQAQILKLLKKLQQKFNLTILFITHDVNLLKVVANSVAVLHHGHIIEQDTVENFLSNPQHPYSQQLVNASRLKPKLSTEQSLTTPIFQAQDLNIYFPIQRGILKRTVDWVKAVDQVNLKLYTGRTLALVGESGSGKTTLGRGLLRLIDPTSGSIDFNGIDLTKLSTKMLLPLRKDIQIIFQDPFSALNPRMLVGDIIAEGLDSLGLVKTEKERQTCIDDLLQKVDLTIESKYKYPHQFSGGQRQRIVIARALAVKPKVVICDEPTSALDVTTQAQIINLLLELQKQYQLSYLFITHNIPLAAAIADEIAVMYDGHIVEHGLVEQIMHHPQHSYTKKLLAAIP